MAFEGDAEEDALLAIVGGGAVGADAIILNHARATSTHSKRKASGLSAVCLCGNGHFNRDGK
ncbi:Uncharacterized protein APZ42_028124 [Daphnia magna]|nr:Uncharacterized protein APZ42_028124 [Daphnia magna]